MTKVIIGVILVLAMVAPVSASIITQAELDSSYDIVPVGDSSYNLEFLTSIATPGTTLTFSPGTWWFNGLGVDGGIGATSASSENFSAVSDNLTISFSTPVSVFGFDALPDDYDVEYDLTAAFYSPSGSLLDSSTLPATDINLTGWQFFGAYESSGIGSVVISTTDNGIIRPALLIADMEVAAPEPSTSLLLAVGLFGLGLASRRRWAR